MTVGVAGLWQDSLYVTLTYRVWLDIDNMKWYDSTLGDLYRVVVSLCDTDFLWDKTTSVDTNYIS